MLLLYAVSKAPVAVTWSTARRSIRHLVDKQKIDTTLSRKAKDRHDTWSTSKRSTRHLVDNQKIDTTLGQQSKDRHDTWSTTKRSTRHLVGKDTTRRTLVDARTLVDTDRHDTSSILHMIDSVFWLKCNST